ncbi:MAG: hypothetical protein QOJ91_2588 [Sphingomonadales bacterium]|jgi:hypothetical protein|nr:hypothetical protein [Sphingomonadales bacterium]
MLPLFVALAVALAAVPAAPAAAPSRHVAKIMARADGATPETAYKVAGVADEYAIVRALGLQARSQSLTIRKKPYDVLTVVDPRDGKVRQLWFDISRFY